MYFIDVLSAKAVLYITRDEIASANSLPRKYSMANQNSQTRCFWRSSSFYTALPLLLSNMNRSKISFMVNSQVKKTDAVEKNSDYVTFLNGMSKQQKNYSHFFSFQIAFTDHYLVKIARSLKFEVFVTKLLMSQGLRIFY